MNAVGKTSLLVAAMRAVETKRGDAEGRLFSDPLAERLAGPEGMALLQRALAESGEQPAIAVRTAYMDQKITEAVAQGARQIVMLAAGMDSRAFRMTFTSDLRLFELDREEVLNYKRQRLGDAVPRCNRKTVAVDLREEWSASLLQAGFERGIPTLWLVEGLLMYLDEAQVLTLFARINSLAAAGDFLLCDILGRALLNSPHLKKQLDFLNSIGAPWRFGVDEPEHFFAQLGWKAQTTQPGEFAPHRWPFPTVPRNIPNVPRGYYVEARKN